MAKIKQSDLHKHIQKDIHTSIKKDKFYGTTTIGARGQVVIPVQARKDLKLKPGDQLMVMGKLGKALGLIKSEQMQELVEMMMKSCTGMGMEKELKVYMEKVFGANF